MFSLGDFWDKSPSLFLKILNMHSSNLSQIAPPPPKKNVITSTNYMSKNSNIGYNWLFQILIEYYKRVQLYIWAVAGHEMGTLSIRAQNFNSYLISQVFY